VTAAATPERDELLEIIDAHYPGATALGLLPLCGPHCGGHSGDPCGAPGKRPLDARWQGAAAQRWADTDTDAESWRARIADHVARGGNVGWCPPAGVLVLDADTPESVAYLEHALPDAPVQDTARGAHYVVRVPVDLALRARSGVEIAPGVRVDLRPGLRAQIVVEPSIHASGALYTWRRSLPADLAELPELPPVLLAVLREIAGEPEPREREAYEPTGEPADMTRLDAILAADADIRRRFDRDSAGLADTSPSGVDLSLASLATCRGLDAEMAEALVRESRERAGLPARPESYYRATIGRAVASAREQAERRTERAESGASVTGFEPLTDAGNAERFAREHGADLGYVWAWGRWAAWDRTRWAVEQTGEEIRRAKATVRRIYAEAANIGEPNVRKATAGWARKSEAVQRIHALVTLARAELPADADDFDREPMLLNAMNGTIDLGDGTLRQHDRADRITKRCETHYDPTAKAPTWERFLGRILPDPDVRAFVQRAVGYSLTGDTSEQVLFIAHGTGANGKSTFLETLRLVLGDYAKKTPGETLLAKREGGVPNDVAALRGARFVAAVETADGRRLAETTVKELTGGDTVSARFMRAEWFEFRPVLKLWLGTNHRPQVRGTDEAIWRRLRLVPFNVTIPPDERDRTLPARLARELPGVLAWAVAGCLEWRKHGLAAPAAVTAATAAYRTEQDVLGQFLAERTERLDGSWTSTAALYAAFGAWCDASGEKAPSKRALVLALSERGLCDERRSVAGRKARGWAGLHLLPPGPEGDTRDTR